MRSAILLSILTFFLSSNAIGQQRDLFNDFGQGFLFLRVCEATGISIRLHDAPHGKEVGLIDLNNASGYTEITARGDAGTLSIKTIMVEYETSGIVVYGMEDGWYKVSSSSSAGTPYWVNPGQLKAMNGVYWTWLEYILHNKQSLFPEVTGIRMNLRTEPSTAGEKVILLSDDSFMVTPTGKSKGAWIEVKVEKMKGGFCEDMTVISRYKGWIKIIDSSGYPNMFYYAAGC